MHLHELKLWNFRQYGSNEFTEINLDFPILTVQFNKRLNLLVGENDSGKSTVVDAIKYVVLTQSREWIKPELADFFVADPQNPDVTRSKKMRIECTFITYDDEEAKNFLEWLKISKKNSEKVEYRLTVYLEAEVKSGNVYSEILAGSRQEGTRLDTGARDLLRATYLMPLRDTESELAPKRGSRLSQILSSYSAFNDTTNSDEHKIQQILKVANNNIRDYFKDDVEGKRVLSTINKHLKQLIDSRKAQIDLTDPSLKSILEKLILNLGTLKEGLGSNNLLFIAAELLLLETGLENGVKLALIEEVEAHLHPQTQLRLIEYLQESSSFADVQFILTTHSPNLASKIKLKNLLICKDKNVYPMGPKHTKLRQDDYAFMERFLDVTKANLFFCKGLILVEGDSENLLLPVFAKLIGVDFPQVSVSVVNMRTLSFIRYSRIYLRKEEPLVNLPVSCLRDLDIQRNLNNNKVIVKNGSENPEEKKKRIERDLNDHNVKAFVSPSWTFEYEISQSCLKDLFYQAVLVSEILSKNSEKKFNDIFNKELVKRAQEEIENLKDKFEGDHERIAYEIYAHKILGRKRPITGKGSTPISKAIISQSFVKIIEQLDEGEKNARKAEVLKDPYLKYLVKSIEYASDKELWQGGV